MCFMPALPALPAHPTHPLAVPSLHALNGKVKSGVSLFQATEAPIRTGDAAYGEVMALSQPRTSSTYIVEYMYTYVLAATCASQVCTLVDRKHSAGM